MSYIAALPDRAVLEVAGEDRIEFLQGLVSNDVTEVAPGRAVWAALLTPQGKWLADFFVFADGERSLIDCEAGQAEMLQQRLSRYRLRAKVTIRPVPIPVHAAWAGLPPTEGVVAPDPRLDEGVGWRVLGAISGVNATGADYDRHRLQLGLPAGSLDMEPDKSTLVEAGFDELHGISWTKGCYMGQELTARTKYRGLVKRRLTRVRIEGAVPAPGTPVRNGEAEVGTMRSGRDEWGLALLRLEAIRADRLQCGDALLIPEPASWMQWEPIRLATA
ncbi:MAG: folate-binding protein YgfZ [Acetobacteraceae bacterium]|nr:folate-binding protein YgfZ [Acetobacteraceae bacterium]